MGDEYVLPIGLDLTSTFEQLDGFSSKLGNVQSAAQKSNEAVKQVFTTARDAGQQATSTMMQNVAAVKQQSDAINQNINQFKSYYSVLQQIAQQNPKSFSGDALKQYQQSMQTILNYTKGLGSETANAFNPEKIQELDQKLKGVTGDLQQFQTILQFIKENTGSLNLSVGANNQLSGTIAQVEDLLNQAATASGSATEKIDGNFDTMSAKVVSLRTQIRNLRDQLGNLDPDSQAYKNILAQASELQDKQRDIQEQMNLIGSDTHTTDALIQGAQGIAGAFTAAQGAIALFGNDNDQLQQTLIKLTAAMSILQGIQSVGQIIDKNSALNKQLLILLNGQQAESAEAAAVATEAQTEATEGMAAADETATAAQWSLNAAMDANPAGVLILAITALVAVYSLLGNETDKEIEKQKNLHAALGDLNSTSIELAKSYGQIYADRVTDAQNALALAQAQGKSEGQIYTAKLNVLSAQKEQGVSMLANMGITQQDIKYNETLLEVRLEQLHAIESQIQSNGKLSDSDQKRVDALKSEIQNIQTYLAPAQQAQQQIKQANAETAQLQAARQEQLYQDGLKSAVAFAEARVELAQKGSQQEYDAQIAAVKAEMNQELANVNLTEGERYKIKADTELKIKQLHLDYLNAQLADDINTQKSILTNAVAGSEDEYNAKVKLLSLQAQQDLNVANLTASQKKLINDKLNQDILNATSEYTAKQFDIQNEELTNDLNNKLAFAQKGSAEELTIQKALVDAKAASDKNQTEQTAAEQNENAELTASKLHAIDVKALADKKALDQDYVRSKIQADEDLLSAEMNLKNTQLQGTVDNPVASSDDVYKAQQQQRENEYNDIVQQQYKLESTWKEQGLTFEEYQTKMTDLQAQAVAKRNELNNAEIQNILDFNKNLESQIKSKGVDLFGSLFNIGDNGQMSDEDKARVQVFMQNFGSLLSTSYTQLTQALTQQAQQQINAIQSVISALNDQISTQQSVVDEQQALADKGMANDLDNAKKKLAALQDEKTQEVAAQQKATDKLIAIQKVEAGVQAAQIIGNEAMMVSELLLAAAKIFGSFASIPLGLGIPVAIGVIASMYAAFQSIKTAFSSAAQVNGTTSSSSTTPSYRQGGGLQLDGPSHEQGGIGLYSGNKKIAEYEGGEYLFAINKQNRHYLPLLEAINNDDQREIMKLILNEGRLPMETVRNTLQTQRQVDDMKAQYAFSFDNPMFEKLAALDELAEIKQLLKRPSKSVTDYGDYIEIKEGNITRKVRKKK